MKDEVIETVPIKENCKEKILIIEECKTVDLSIEKAAPEENVTKNEKVNEETTTKSKKKKKKTQEVNNAVNNTDNNNVTNSELPAEQVISEISAPQPVNSTNNSPVVTETSDTLIGKLFFLVFFNSQ